MTGKPARFLGSARVGLAGLAAITCFVGCNEPLHRRLVQQRRESFARIVQNLEHSEARRPANLERTLAHVSDWHERDVVRTRQMPDRLAEAIDNDFDRWERTAPFHRQRTHDLIKANPDSFAQSAARIFN